MIATCTDCGTLYEAGSEEQAYETERWCFRCRIAHGVSIPPDHHDRTQDAPPPPSNSDA